MLLSVEGNPLIVHDEPVLENGQVVGLTTSGAKGVRTGLTLALALVQRGAGRDAGADGSAQFRSRYRGNVYMRQRFSPSRPMTRAAKG